MGCVCCSASSLVSILLDALERISMFTVCALLTCCILFTIISILLLGVGIGYHYCFVQNSVESMEKASKASGALRRSAEPFSDSGAIVAESDVPGPSAMRSIGKTFKKRFIQRRDVKDSPMTNNNTLNELLNANSSKNLLGVISKGATEIIIPKISKVVLS